MFVVALGQSAAPDSTTAGFYARALLANTGLLSKRVSSVDVDVLAGTVQRGDAVELIRSDGRVIPATVDRMQESNVLGMHTHAVLLKDFQLMKEELGSVDIVRAPGLVGPRLPTEDERPGTASLLEAVRAGRRDGFPVASTGKGITDIVSRGFAEALPRLPDEAVVLIVQNRLTHARAKTDDANRFESDCQIAAAFLGAIGLQEDGDRLLVAAAASLRGHKVSPALRAAASTVAVGVLAAENEIFAVGAKTKGIGWALGIEMGDAFAVGWKSGVSALGEGIETRLLEAGRAVEVAWCDKCSDAVTLEQRSCPRDGKQPKDRIVVVRADAAQAEAAIRADPPRGGFWRR